MTTNHIKAILTSLRAMVIKMLPAYKFYLGSTTETTATQICHGVMSVEDGKTSGNGALTLDDASFAGFVEGETYTVAVNGVSGEYVAKLFYGIVIVTNAADFENPTEDGWSAFFDQNGTCVYSVSGTYANATISISQTKTVTTKKYQTKKLDKSLLPDGVESGIEAANTKAATALSAAQAAQDTANEAISNANTAQTTADTALSTANTAKSTADTALARAVEPYTGYTQMAPLYKNGGFSAWRSVVQRLLYDKTEGYFSSDVLGTTALNFEDMPDGAFYARVYVGNQSAMAFLSKTATGNDSWFVSGFAVIGDGYSRTGEILYVSSNTIQQYAAKGLFLTFRAPDSMLLKSSTSGSDKQFRITVDDTGKISATEITDA